MTKTYETPELFELGNAEDLILSTSAGDSVDCDCKCKSEVLFLN